MTPPDDIEIEIQARALTEMVIARNGNRTGRYAIIIKSTVDDADGNGVMSWDWYWNPSTAQEGDGT